MGKQEQVHFQSDIMSQNANNEEMDPDAYSDTEDEAIEESIRKLHAVSTYILIILLQLMTQYFNL